MSEHGTTSRYTSGCRCTRCRGANAEYQRAYQAKRRAIGTITHIGDGTFTWTPTLQAEPLQGPWLSVPQYLPPSDPLDALVSACQDLREAFAAYHQAHTQEPAA